MAMYRFLIIIIQIHIVLLSYAQRTTTLEIIVDSTSLQDIVIDYNDGISLHVLNDSLLHKSKFIVPLNGQYGLLSLHAQNGKYWSFWVSEKPGKLSISIDEKESEIKILEKKNLINPFDPENKIYTEYITSLRQESLKLEQLYSTFGYDVVQKNDSLNLMQNQLFKSIDSVKIKVLEKYPNEYFSFFMAKNLLEGAINQTPDLMYLKKLRAFMTSTYPKYFLELPEALYLLETMDYKINALNKENDIQDLLFEDEDNNKFTLADLNSEYVLIDFWATWCAPCMEQLPELDELSKLYSTSKLQIIGVNVDENYAKFKSASSSLSKKWIHIFDYESKIRRFLDINSFPTLIFLDENRNLIILDNVDKSKIVNLLK